ncbi:probable WRKY transcription factor 75 [Olea europaea subsp. europaea]|uniref:Probable WRKY transcription factor 75 n=1 Tax=Olea europaea subsp. europaea TaxID=158383 RepID=A0A8S0PQE8_OLEEU|nr:probable WRKY transcription factor 75 [Olea europaea subsp. europaea]
MENHATQFLGSSIMPFPFNLSPIMENSHVMNIFSNNNVPNGVVLGSNQDIRFQIAQVKEVSQKNKFIQIDQNVVKKSGKKTGEMKNREPRFAFHTRSQVEVLDDGYRWRKYGQKLVKNNKFPRSYYRCTYEECNVKKQVQRLSEDEGIVVTTYEGLHTHPAQKPSENFEQILNQMQTYLPN